MPRRPELRVEAGGHARRRRRPRRLASTAVVHRRHVVDPREVADADRAPRRELEPEEVLERTRQPLRATRPARCRDSRTPSTVIRPGRRLVEPAEQLHERRLAGAVLADEGDDRSRRQLERRCPRARAATSRDSGTTRARAGYPMRTARERRDRRMRCVFGVVLEPGETLRAVDQNQRRNSASPTVAPMYATSARRRQARAATSPAGASSPDGHEHDGADICGAEQRPRQRSATRPPPAGRRRPRRTTCSQRLPACRRRWRPIRSRACLCRAPAAVPRSKRWRARRHAGCGAFLGARVRRPARHVDSDTVGSAKTPRAAPATGWIDAEQHQRDHASRQNPAARREQRHVDVVEDEDLIAQHCETVEVLRALVVRDGGDRGLQTARRATRARSSTRSRNRRWTRRADRAQEPRRQRPTSRGRTRPCRDEIRSLSRTPSTEQLEPQRQQRVRAAPRAATSANATTMNRGSCR